MRWKRDRTPMEVVKGAEGNARKESLIAQDQGQSLSQSRHQSWGQCWKWMHDCLLDLKKQCP